MNPLTRWAKFNAVGIVGAAVQLIALALFERCLRGHTLFCTAFALELTLLHNFIGHSVFTWRDRHPKPCWLQRLARFHASNGAISLAGNLLLVRLLTTQAHLPLILADAIAIVACSSVNFLLGDNWVFRREQPQRPHGSSSPAFS